MKRQRQNLSASPQGKKRKLNVRLLGFFVALFLAVIFALGILRNLAENLSYFKVRDVLVRQNFKYAAPASLDVSYLKGKNIFALDLDRESRYLGQVYPNYKRVRLFRLFPNRLFADFVTRRPVAYIKLYRTFYVSDDLVIFAAPGDAQEDPRLPVITGLETRIFGPKSGTRYTNRELILALRIIGELRLNRVMRNYALKRINAQSLENVSFYLLDGLNLLEVRVGPESLREKINILAGLLIKLKGDRQRLTYIDLRFKDPVIKLSEGTSAGVHKL